MGWNLFTNEVQTKEEEVEVSAPAFSITKVTGAFSAVLAVLLGVLPKVLKQDETMLIACIAAATVLMLGVFALAAVDIIIRQRASAATLKYGAASKDGKLGFDAIPAEELVLQLGHNSDEYEVKLAMVEEGKMSLVSARNGELITSAFTAAPKPK